MTAPQQRITLPVAIGENRERIRVIERTPPPGAIMLPPQAMGNVADGISLDVGGGTFVRLRAGVAFRPFPERDFPTGSNAFVNYIQHQDGIFNQLSTRWHAAVGLVLNDYEYARPWRSEPFSGSVGFFPAGATFDLTPFFGDWDGKFYCFYGVTGVPGDTVHFEALSGEFDQDEDFGFDTPNGHVGYMFWNWTTTSALAVRVTFATGPGQAGYTRVDRGTFTGTVEGAVIAEDDSLASTEMGPLTTTDPVGVGEMVIAMVATDDQEAGAVDAFGNNILSLQSMRPNLYMQAPLHFVFDQVTEIPHWYDARNDTWRPFAQPSEKLGA